MLTPLPTFPPLTDFVYQTPEKNRIPFMVLLVPKYHAM